MEINYFLVTVIAVILICTIRGARRGILRIIFGIVAWVFLICFVNYSSDAVKNIIYTSTEIPTSINQGITTHLTERYNTSEESQSGSGEEAVLALIPSTIRDQVMGTVRSSVDNMISLIADELTSAAVGGISTIISVAIGILAIFIVSKLIKAIGLVPGIKDVNRLLGVVAGFAEGLLIVWLIMYIADCFPTSAFGEYILSSVDTNVILGTIYENNVIENILGL